MSKILIAGFDFSTQELISEKLNRIGYESQLLGCNSPLNTDLRQSSAILASADDVICTRWLARLREANSTVPFILVGRVGDDAKWLAALEAGATDYCSTDVDSANLAWMLKNALSRTYLTSAA
jgi:DNA-binding response OmpR family regulator